MFLYGIVSSLLLILFFATANVFSYQESILNGFSDIKTYYYLSQNEFSANAINIFSSHHLERWMVHYLSGRLSRLTEFDVWHIYQILVLMCIISVVLLVSTLKENKYYKLIFLSFLLLNPYTYRLYWSAPGMISDCLFYTSIIFFCYSIKYEKSLILVISSCLMIIFRQTGILLLFPLILCAVEHRKDRKLILSSLISIIFILILFVFNKNLTESLYGKSDGYFLRIAFGFVFWLINSFNFIELIKFLGKYSFFLLSIITIIYLNLIDLSNRNTSIKSKKNRIFFTFTLAFLLVQVQPLAGGPGITGGNIQRLAAFGIPFLVFLSHPIFTSKFNTIILICCLFLASLHHKFTFLINFDYGYFIFILFWISPLIFVLYLSRNQKINVNDNLIN